MGVYYLFINDYLIKYLIDVQTCHYMYVFRYPSKFKLCDIFDYNPNNYIKIDNTLCNRRYYDLCYEARYKSITLCDDYICLISKHDIASAIPLKPGYGTKSYIEYRTCKCDIIIWDNRHYCTIKCECFDNHMSEANYICDQKLYSIIYCKNCSSDMI